MNATIRKMKRTDKRACIGLLQQLYGHLSPEELGEQFFWGEEQAYVLLKEGKIVGVIVWEEYDYLPDNSCLLELSAIVIDKDNRLRGFGRDLYRVSLGMMGEEMDICGIHVLGTQDSVGFYERVMPDRRVKTPALSVRGIQYISLLCEI